MSRSLRQIMLMGFALFFGALTGFLFAAGNGITLDGHDHGDPAHHGQANVNGHDKSGHDGHDKMHDMPFEVSAADAPSLSLMAMPDSHGGWNLHLMTENFEFVPARVGGAAVLGEGHGHLYIDGVKKSRLYGHWVHIGALTKGEHMITVSLNAHDHRVFAVAGQPVQAHILVVQD